MKLGQLLGDYMHSHSLSTRELAKEVGCDHSTIHRIIHGKPVSLDVLLCLLTWLINPKVK